MGVKNALLGLATLLVCSVPLYGSVNAEIGSSLVRLDASNQLTPLGPDALKTKKLIALYYSAHWCPPCRAFTPILSKFYDDASKTNPEFELIFISADRTASDMQKYMEWGKMNFPAVAFDQIKSCKWIGENSASGIPYLVVFDADGKMVLGKAPSQDWRPPQEVLAELQKLLAKK